MCEAEAATDTAPPLLYQVAEAIGHRCGGSGAAASGRPFGSGSRLDDGPLVRCHTSQRPVGPAAAPSKGLYRFRLRT